MIGMILVTHGRLAEEMRAAMEHVVGPQRRVATISIAVDDDVEQRRQDIERAVDEVDAGDGVVILTDMFGGTPSNLAISMMARGNVEVIAGMNLPMLVKLAKIRSRQTLAECSEIAEMAGRKYIAAASHVLASCKTTNLCRSLDPRQIAGPADAHGHGAGNGNGHGHGLPHAPGHAHAHAAHHLREAPQAEDPFAPRGKAPH